MVRIETVYEGDLRCRVTHGPSGRELTTGALADNEGRGEGGLRQPLPERP